MIVKIYGIYDRKAMFYKYPSFQRSETEARRSLDIGVNTVGTEINRFPTDFELCEVGTFDDEVGVITPHLKPIIVCSAAEYVREVKVNE